MSSARTSKSRREGREKRTAEQSAQLIAEFYKTTDTCPPSARLPPGNTNAWLWPLNGYAGSKRLGPSPTMRPGVLDEAHPHWTGRADHARERWQRTAEDFIAWVKQNGRFPSASSDDAAERFLSRWLFRQRYDARRERFPARVRELDTRLPEWRETFSDQQRQSYLESAQQVADYVNEHGTLPAPDGQSGSEAERLSEVLWVLRNQKRNGRLSTEAIQTLDAAFPGWLDGITLNAERHWQQRATEFIEWVKENGRNPHRGAWDRKERALAGWLARQKVHAKNGEYPARIKELNARLPGWDQTA